MKPLITGLAFIILSMFFNVFQIEQDSYIRSQEYVKVLCDDMSAAGVLFYEEDAYSLGNKIFDKTKSESVMKDLIMLNMDLDENLEPKALSYWKSTVELNTYYIDDSGFLYTYENGQLKNRTACNYGTLFEIPQTQYKKLLMKPTVIVVVSVEYPVSRANWIEWPEINRSSAYEYLDRN